MNPPTHLSLDPITLAVIQNGLQQVCNEMDLAFCRAAFSPVISEAMDRSDGIYDAVDGALIAQGELGLPVFVGTMQFSTRAVIERVRANGWTVEPGDVFIVNDPYMGGTHLMDVKFVKPFFHEGKIYAWLANTGHWPDTGGMVPGGFSAKATESEQEGLRLPPVKLYKKGVLDEEILSIILSNIRIADQRIGDIKAQAAENYESTWYDVTDISSYYCKTGTAHINVLGYHPLLRLALNSYSGAEIVGPATATATAANGMITGITVQNSGNGYLAPPLVTIIGLGAGAVAEAEITGGQVSAINVINGGAGYVTNPQQTQKIAIVSINRGGIVSILVR